MRQALLLLMLLWCSSCTEMLVGPEAPRGAVATFDALWKDFDEHYSGFALRNVNWDSAYQRFRPGVYDGMPDSSLANVIDSLLMTLRDAHVNFATPFGFHGYSRLIADTPSYFHYVRTVKEYLGATAESSGNDNFLYGFLNDSIAYLYIGTFSDGPNVEWEQEIEPILAKLARSKALVLDLRNNNGGEVFRFLYLLGHFTDHSYPFMKMKARNGPSHDSFTEWFTITSNPTGEHRYTKPIALLTNAYSVSAAEWFTVGMKALPYVTVIGDTTQGAMSGRSDKELPNGWIYSYSTQIVADMDLNIFEGKGIPPEITIRQTEHEDSTRTDLVIEKALEVLSK